MKVYYESTSSRLIVDDEAGSIKKFSPAPGGVFQSPDGAGSALVSIKSVTGVCLEPRPLGDLKNAAGTLYASVSDLEEDIKDFFVKAGLQHAGISILNQDTLSIPDSDTWTEITVPWDMHTDSKGFVMDLVNSVLVHEGQRAVFNFSGTSDVQSQKLAVIEYALIKNADLASPLAVSKHSFTSAQSIESLSVHKAFTLEPGDTLNLFAKSSVSGNVLTIYSLDTTFWGDR